MAINLFTRTDRDPADEAHILRLQRELRLVQNACARKARTIRGLRERQVQMRAQVEGENNASDMLNDVLRAAGALGMEFTWRDDGGFAGAKLNGEKMRKRYAVSKNLKREYAKGYAAGRRKGRMDAQMIEGVSAPANTNGSGAHDDDTGGGLLGTVSAMATHIKTSQ